MTALSGHVLTLQDQPLADVTLQLGQAAAAEEVADRPHGLHRVVASLSISGPACSSTSTTERAIAVP